MLNQPMNAQADDTLLSALVDGELSAPEVGQACALWRGDALARERWHDYHLIGDVLRSEDLARSPVRDDTLFERIQTELARQPVVLAPTIASTKPEQAKQSGSPCSASTAQTQTSTWHAGVAAMAGVLVVAGAWLLTQETAQKGGLLEASNRGLAPIAAAASAIPSSGREPVIPAATTPMASMHDPKLDLYLVAHRQFSSASVLGAPSGSVRQVAADVSGR
jgi:sigma-E factor negative regulatory protein RseA